MKKVLFRMLLLLLTLCLAAAPVTALAAEAEEPLPTAEPGTDPMEDARALMKELGEQLRTGGKDLLDGIRATLQSIDTRELMDRLGNIFQNTRDLTDEELAEKLRSLAEDTHVELTDAQVETLVKLCRRELARRPPAEVNGVDVVRICAPHRHLITYRIDIPLTEVERGRRIERTIDASARTKRNMYVDSCHFEHKITN